MWSRVLRRGQRLTLTDVHGGASVAALFYNSELLTERYNMPDTLKAQHIARLTLGNSLFSDMGHVLCSIVEDSCGWHDTITGMMNAASSQQKFGQGGYQQLRNDFYRNSRDNFLTELGKYELGKRDIVANVNFFTKVAVDAEGNLKFVADNSKAGNRITLRADMNTLFVLSNTPHPLDPKTEYAPPTVELQLAAGEPAAPVDVCRNQCEQSGRAFALNDQYFL
jgi:urea carboxylase-associated protein 2